MTNTTTSLSPFSGVSRSREIELFIILLSTLSSCHSFGVLSSTSILVEFVKQKEDFPNDVTRESGINVYMVRSDSTYFQCKTLIYSTKNNWFQ